MLKFETQDELIEYLKSEEGATIAESIKAPLIAKRDELLGEVKTLRSRYEGIDPEEVTTLKTRAQEAETLKEQLEQLKSQSTQPNERVEEVKSQLQAELARQQAAHEAIMRRYQEATVSSQIRDAINRHNGIPELLEGVIRQRVRVTPQENGDVTLETLSREGKPLFVNGEEATLDHLVKELSADERYGRAFNTSTPTGSGSRGNTSLAGKDLSKLTISEKMRLAASNPALISQFRDKRVPKW